MTAILTHQGCTGPYIASTRPPAHLTACIEQYQLFNYGDLHILTDRENLQHLPERAFVYPHAIEDYHSPKIDYFVELYGRGPLDFWTVTFTRLMYIENFMAAYSLFGVCEFANDVLIYFDISKFDPVFKRLYPGIAVTPCGPQHTLDGFMYINDPLALAKMTSFFINTLEDFGIEGIKRQYGYDMVNEMTMMHLYSEQVGIPGLPIMPWGKFSENFDEFGALFDPATWGQYVGGTRTAGPGIKPQNHYIGLMLNECPQYGVVWQVENGLRVPYFSHDGELTKINNLHIHSKNMGLYMSKMRDSE